MEEKKHQEGKIYLTFNNVSARTKCAISGIPFKPDLLMFCLSGDSERPVRDSVALKKGFTMTGDDLDKLQHYYFEGVTNEETDKFFKAQRIGG